MNRRRVERTNGIEIKALGVTHWVARPSVRDALVAIITNPTLKSSLVAGYTGPCAERSPQPRPARTRSCGSSRHDPPRARSRPSRRPAKRGSDIRVTLAGRVRPQHDVAVSLISTRKSLGGVQKPRQNRCAPSFPRLTAVRVTPATSSQSPHCPCQRGASLGPATERTRLTSTNAHRQHPQTLWLLLLGKAYVDFCSRWPTTLGQLAGEFILASPLP